MEIDLDEQIKFIEKEYQSYFSYGTPECVEAANICEAILNSLNRLKDLEK